MIKQLLHISHDTIPIFINEESSILILGSLPSVKSKEDGFYYAHPRNRFFKVLSSVFDEEEPISINDRKQFLKKHRIALYDVIYECDIYGSSDSSIKNPVVIDIRSIMDKYPKIKVVGINGNKAKTLFDKYLLPVVNQYNIKIVYLPSTSPANARMSIDELVDQYYKLFE